ncbi:TRAP transporter small permease [Pseudonocardia kunmingensis]|uniref:Tripartite ATP-independent transporter DctQ subunit n=1 Tax=Pseudonocardia kunmingensis TaxID=630975 RepID=A0A543DPE2_9PSEU|nr:TRAP transporter small permease [Pseudonocardia kunmingensis]TQM11201.1 tripartite ATP-independent transporter DctQ subunit [Pseudonocardia kunmingensis]
MDGVQKVIGTALLVVTGTTVLVLMLHVVANALSRSFLNRPLEGTLEYVGNWYLPVVVLLGLAVAQQRRQHIEARLLFDRAPRSIQIEFQLFTYLLLIALSLIIAWYSYVEAWRNLGVGLTAGVSGVVIWPVTFAVPIGFLLFAIQLLIDGVLLVQSKGATLAEGAE